MGDMLRNYNFSFYILQNCLHEKSGFNCTTKLNSIPVQTLMSMYHVTHETKRLPNTFEGVLAASSYAIPALSSHMNGLILSIFKWWTTYGWAYFVLEPLLTIYYRF